MASDEARLDALCELAKLLCDDDALLAEVRLAWADPERYVEKYAARRDVEATCPTLSFLALIDAMKERRRCAEVDWRSDPKDVSRAVRGLLRASRITGWKPPPRLSAIEEIEDILRAVGASVTPHGLSLCGLDHQSDSVALVLLRTDWVEAAIELARRSDVGRFKVWRRESEPVEPPPAILLRTVTSIDVPLTARPTQFIAMPGRRTVTFDGRALQLSRSDGSAELGLDRELLPDFDRAGPVEHVLVRSGQAFGLASRRFVRLWAPSGESVLYTNDPPLPPSESGAFPGFVSGGVSDDPKVVVAVAHRANAPAEDVHPVVLRLSGGKYPKARFEELGPNGRLGHASRDRLPMSSALRLNAPLPRTPRLGAIAWLDDLPYVVARGDEEGSSSYAVFSKYDAPFGRLELLIDLGEDCTAKVSSSGAFLLVTYSNRAEPSCAVHSLEHLTRPPRALALPAGATLLDHEDDAFWYFEPWLTGGRYVLAEAANPYLAWRSRRIFDRGD